jgi:hypothetical protein
MNIAQPQGHKPTPLPGLLLSGFCSFGCCGGVFDKELERD